MRQDKSQAELTSFEDLADRFTEEIRSGKRPRIEDYAEHNPIHATAIHRLFPVLEMMEQRGTPVEDLSESGLLEAENLQLNLDPAIRQLGDYRIVREIGRGGMGIVFEAEQESLGRRVALKLLPNSAQFDERRQQRFQQEAQASAKLQHPNIVNVFGVGCQEDTSYFVMQFIDGHPLNSVLKEVSRIRTGGLDATVALANAEVATLATNLQQNDLSDDSSPSSFRDPTEEPNAMPESGLASGDESSISASRSFATNANPKAWWRNIAQTGLQVASALEHAHEKRILHRDIKPANLMMDHSGNVWVTDFGLAKHFESNDLTRTGEVVGTLRYMSPEQLNGKADERSDIFGLGLTLYEMAALRPAYFASDRNDLMKQALEASPPRLRTIDRHIPRDLETIIHKCIAAEPKRRYHSASDVKDDLRRLLSGEPVLARRINFIERTAKWCRRRPVIAGLCIALALSLIAGIAGITWQWRQTESALAEAKANLTEAKLQNERADQHFREARESVDKFYTIISEQRLLQEPGLQPLRKELMQEAADYYRNFSEQYANDESLRLETGKALLRLVQIEGSYNANPVLLETCEEAIAIFLELNELDPDDPRTALELAEAYGIKTRILQRSDIEASLQSLQDSITVLQDVSARFPDSMETRSKLATHYQIMGLTYETLDRSTGRTDRSFKNYMQAYALRKELTLQNSENLRSALHLADTCRDLGIIYRKMQQTEKAIASYDEAVSILEPLVERHPDDRDARRTLGSIANSIGFFYANVNSELDLDRAAELYQLSKTQYEILTRQDPLVIEYQDGLGRAMLNLGSVYQHQNKLDLALAARQKAVEVRSRISAANPTTPHLKSNCALAMNGVGSVLRELGRIDEATELHDQAFEYHLAAIEIDPRNPRYKFRAVQGLVQLARVHSAAKRFEFAMEKVSDMVQFIRPDDTHTVAMAAKEYLMIACKIGKMEADSRSEDDESLRLESLDRARKEFRKATERGLDVLKWYADDTDLRYFGELPEGIEMHDWLQVQFGSE
ncbi:serine/threonine-protein kinase [Mariniblastus fucicola]|uniref:Serine/threonine-protein kinase PrkC n=1 Tax=Mariniblastus fucicola TaxID=980251 RepID=A0A5B9P1H1_9BACT|nr:serine/threonine-protein kinase [Mariniblastus fucicola]QEG20367.1 Serine/threonine-protein kinase PrkC [Mariniblastus fucicola]